MTTVPLPVGSVPPLTAAPPAAVRTRRPLLRAGRVAALLVLPLLLFAGATGWLYLLRHTGALAAGPRLRDALPFQRLAGEGGQPLLRFAVAWLPAGVIAGLALRGLRVRRPLLIAGLFGLATAALVIVGGGVADGITANEHIGPHIAAQPGRLAPWLAAVLVAVPAAAVAWWER